MFVFANQDATIYFENNNEFMLNLGSPADDAALQAVGLVPVEGCIYHPVLSYAGREPACRQPLAYFDCPADRVFFEVCDGNPSVMFLLGGQWVRVRNRLVGSTFCIEFLAHLSALGYEMEPAQWDTTARALLAQRIRIPSQDLAQTIIYAHANPVRFYRNLAERDVVPMEKLIHDYIVEQAYLVLLAVHQLATQPTLALLPGYVTPFPLDFLTGSLEEEIVATYLNTAPAEFGRPEQYRALLEQHGEFRSWAVGFYQGVNESGYVCQRVRAMYEPLGGCNQNPAERPLSLKHTELLCGIYYALRDLVSIPTGDDEGVDGLDYLWAQLGSPEEQGRDWLLASAHGRFAFRYNGIHRIPNDYLCTPQQEEELRALYVVGDWTGLAIRYDELLRAK